MPLDKTKSIKSVGDILVDFNPLEDKYISREFQAYGYHIAETLNDMKHKSLYIKLAKTVPRPFLEKALTYVADAKVKRKGALFMWKLKELGAWKKDEKATKKSPASARSPAKAGEKVKDIPF